MSQSTNDIVEELSYAYVYAVASRCGFSVDRLHRDNDSIDVQVRARGLLAPESKSIAPMLHLQLKATAQKSTPKPKTARVGAGCYPFELPIKNYDDLRGPRGTPMFLVVLFLPADASRWLSQTEDGLVSRRCAYWCSLRGYPETTNASTKTVYVPRSNVFDGATLQKLMIESSKGNFP